MYAQFVIDNNRKCYVVQVYELMTNGFWTWRNVLAFKYQGECFLFLEWLRQGQINHETFMRIYNPNFLVTQINYKLMTNGRYSLYCKSEHDGVKIVDC